MNRPNLEILPEEPAKVLLAPDEYVRTVLDSNGGILQFNVIGVFTLATAYRGLGDFEHILWSDQDFKTRDVGERIARSTTLETAHGFHHALSKRMWSGPEGKTTRERGTWFKDEVDAVLFKLLGPASSEDDALSEAIREVEFLTSVNDPLPLHLRRMRALLELKAIYEYKTMGPEKLKDLEASLKDEGMELEGLGESISESERKIIIPDIPELSLDDLAMFEVAQGHLEDEHPEMDPQQISNNLKDAWKPGIGIIDLLLAAESPEPRQVPTKKKANRIIPKT
jgi:hypothetical protein